MLKKSLLIAALFVPAISYSHDYIATTTYETVERPRQECWNEPVAYRDRDYTGALIGGIAGGILGHQVGRGSGRAAATVIGASTGAIVGDRISDSSTSYSYGNARRCRTVVDHVRVPVQTREVAYVERERYETYYPRPGYVEERVDYYPHDRGWHHGWHKHHHHHHHDDED